MSRGEVGLRLLARGCGGLLLVQRMKAREVVLLLRSMDRGGEGEKGGEEFCFHASEVATDAAGMCHGAVRSLSENRDVIASSAAKTTLAIAGASAFISAVISLLTSRLTLLSGNCTGRLR